MTTKTLKQYLGDAGAAIDESHGADRLYDVLKALAEGLSEMVTAYQATIATATIAAMVTDKNTVLDSLRTSVAVCGTATTTTVQIHVNGVSKGELSTAHDDTDGIKKSLVISPAIDIVAGDLIELVVSAAPTGGTGLSATARFRPVTVA